MQPLLNVCLYTYNNLLTLILINNFIISSFINEAFTGFTDFID